MYEEELEEIEALFSLYDTSGSGSIDAEELTAALDGLGCVSSLLF
jgi:Ca2+-binding EF-hand superfamily protein